MARIGSLESWNEEPRLQLRMTRSHLRIHYTIFEHEKTATSLISTNNGYLLIRDPTVEAFLYHEFSVIWEEGTLREPRTPDEWKTFFSEFIRMLQEDLDQNRQRHYDVKAYLEGKKGFAKEVETEEG